MPVYDCLASETSHLWVYIWRLGSQQNRGRANKIGVCLKLRNNLQGFTFICPVCKTQARANSGISRVRQLRHVSRPDVGVHDQACQVVGRGAVMAPQQAHHLGGFVQLGVPPKRLWSKSRSPETTGFLSISL